MSEVDFDASAMDKLIPQFGEDIVDVDQTDEVLQTAYEITSYGADYPVDGLVKRMQSGDIVVPSFDPAFDGSEDVGAFQRGFVWSRPQMDKFIESLLLGLPVPGIFLVRDRANKLLVLDGQQRLRTLQFFYSGLIGDSRYRLRQVQKPFSNLSYEELEPEDRRRLDDSIIHATVLRQDSEGSQDAVYSIFERLNTGGSPLQPQEIRVALYPGPFLHGISAINEIPSWRSLYGPKSNRLKDQEMILRVFAMYEETVAYSRPLKGYLNGYLRLNQTRILDSSVELWQVFETAMQNLHEHVGPKAFRPVRPLNAAVLDSLAVAVMRRVKTGPITNPTQFNATYNALLSNDKYRQATNSSTAAEETVRQRLEEATSAFAEVV
ncbi:DUF262 domain-containing protein [Glutamicibacter sp. NPDC087583]|uniref:DUF262 domain-containing protein n=1 Tax=Glutamicibacter sp. NPDC087583 TaxID=3363995 RepID=UPI00381BCE39